MAFLRAVCVNSSLRQHTVSAVLPEQLRNLKLYRFDFFHLHCIRRLGGFTVGASYSAERISMILLICLPRIPKEHLGVVLFRVVTIRRAFMAILLFGVLPDRTMYSEQPKSQSGQIMENCHTPASPAQASASTRPYNDNLIFSDDFRNYNSI